MPIIKKPDYNIFASEAKTGEIVDFPNLLRGWGVTLDQTAGKPPMEWFNALQKRTDEWLTYLSQRGLPEWQNTLDYPKDAVVQFGGKFYVAKRNTKDAQPDRSQNDWAVMLGSAASRDVGTATGNVMEVGAFGLGAGPQHKADAYSNIAQIYRLSVSSNGTPGGSTYGVISLPCDGAPSAGYLAAGINGELHVGRSTTTTSNGVTWNRVYTTAYKPTPSDIGAAKITGDTGQKFWVQSAPGDVNSAVPVSLLNSELQKKAALNGSPAQKFKVMGVSDDNEAAVAMWQLVNGLNGKANLRGDANVDFYVRNNGDGTAAVNNARLNYVLGSYAYKGGDANQAFAVAGGSNAESAVAYGQFQSGVNGNGAWTKLPGGGQWCRQNLTVQGKGSLTWTFPASFSATPAIFIAAINGAPNVWFSGIGPASAIIYNNNDSALNVNVLAIW